MGWMEMGICIFVDRPRDGNLGNGDATPDACSAAAGRRPQVNPQIFTIQELPERLWLKGRREKL
jgi:hypothetical protein